jgi:hypothetical protein
MALCSWIKQRTTFWLINELLNEVYTWFNQKVLHLLRPSPTTICTCAVRKVLRSWRVWQNSRHTGMIIGIQRGVLRYQQILLQASKWRSIIVTYMYIWIMTTFTSLNLINISIFERISLHFYLFSYNKDISVMFML